MKNKILKRPRKYFSLVFLYSTPPFIDLKINKIFWERLWNNVENLNKKSQNKNVTKCHLKNYLFFRNVSRESIVWFKKTYVKLNLKKFPIWFFFFFFWYNLKCFVHQLHFIYRIPVFKWIFIECVLFDHHILKRCLKKI